MGNCLSCFNTRNERPSAPESAHRVEVVVEPPVPPVANIEEPQQSAHTVEVVEQPQVAVSTTTVEKIEESPVPTTTGEKIEEPSGSAPTKEEIIESLQALSDPTHLNEFVDIIKGVLEEKKKSVRGSTSESAKEDIGSTSEGARKNESMRSTFFTSGAKFLNFMNGHTEKIEGKKDIYSGNSIVAAEILGQIGELHWLAGGFAVAAYVIQKFDEVSDNKTEALELLSNMVDLATAVIKSRNVIPDEEEKLKKAVMLVVNGSMMCASQIYSGKISRFFKTSANAKELQEMSKRLDHLYRDLNLAISTATGKRVAEMKKQQSMILPVPKSSYPKDAVGIENARDEVIKMLNMTAEDESPLVVVIYGLGGMGKTTLANAVVATSNLDDYNYARIQLDEEKMSKNDLKEKQEAILRNAFPSFHPEGRIRVSDCQEGRDRLKEAFSCSDNKPVFLYVDNALRSEDLKELLPSDLRGMPKRSRVLITTRRLDQTDFLLCKRRFPFPMKTLEKDDAIKILCKDPHNSERIKDDLERILQICGGVPLALRIVQSQLEKMGYNAQKCSRILVALETGKDVREENLSERLIHFVYNEMDDSTKDAFLDICRFFNGYLRQDIEYSVGALEVRSLEEAALVTPIVDDDDRMMLYRGEERLLVHDLVKKKGRDMSASTRFRNVELFSEAAEDETKLKGIKGLWLDPKEEEYVVDVKHLNLMRHSLRVLHLGANARTSAQSPKKFQELRYLQLDNESSISPLPMKVEELDMLAVYYDRNESHVGLSMSKLPTTLRCMWTWSEVTWEESTSTQAIHHHPLLEELCFDGLNIERFPEGLHQLRSLKILTLYDFDKMEEFPEQVCKLSSLIKLRIFGWDNLKRLPQSFGGLKGLTHLQIQYCPELEHLPSSFGELTALEHLSLRHCRKLKDLPGGLNSLKYLCVEECEELSLELYESKADLRIVK